VINIFVIVFAKWQKHMTKTAFVTHRSFQIEHFLDIYILLNC